MAVRVIRARNTDPVVTAPLTITKAAAYCRVSTDSEEQESSYEAQVNQDRKSTRLNSSHAT